MNNKRAYFWKKVLNYPAFSSLFRHNIAEIGPQDLKMVKKDASSNSTQAVKKSAPKLKYEESYGNFPGMSACRAARAA